MERQTRFTPVDELHQSADQSLDVDNFANWATDKGLISTGLVPKEKSFMFAHGNNPFRAKCNEGQIEWVSEGECDAKDVAEVINFTTLQGRKILLNTGTHGDKNGVTVVDVADQGDAQLTREDLKTVWDLPNVAVHIVSKGAGLLTHGKYPDIDIIYAWCFSAQTLKAEKMNFLKRVCEEVTKLTQTGGQGGTQIRGDVTVSNGSIGTAGTAYITNYNYGSSPPPEAPRSTEPRSTVPRASPTLRGPELLGNGDIRCLESAHWPGYYLRLHPGPEMVWNGNGYGTVNLQRVTSPAQQLDFETFKIHTFGHGKDMVVAFESLAFANNYIRMAPDTQSRAKADQGQGQVNVQNGVALYEKFKIVEGIAAGTFALESAGSPGYFLRADASEADSNWNGDGTGTVNCQYGKESYECFRWRSGQ